MSLPENNLSTRPIYGAFLVPDKAEPLVDFEWGGVDLLDTSQGLQVYIWKCYYRDNWICIENDVVQYQLLNVENVKSLSLSFDFNMHPTIAYTTENEDKQISAFLYWYDTAQAAQITTEYGTEYITPQVSLDDHRLHQSANADIIFAYIKNSNLYYRQQRDRFLTERLLALNLGDVELTQIGMTTKNRFQFVYS